MAASAAAAAAQSDDLTAWCMYRPLPPPLPPLDCEVVEEADVGGGGGGGGWDGGCGAGRRLLLCWVRQKYVL